MQPTTTQSRLIRAALAACASFVLLAAVAGSPVDAHGRGRGSPPKAFYLSLGDSLGFGFQEDRFVEMLDEGTYTPEAFNTGDTDVLAARMRQLRPDQQTVNLSCPGESTATMINGGCVFTLPEPEGPGLPIHTSYAGSQLQAAVSFLRSHPHEVSPITVAIGANDAADVFVDRCDFDESCIKRSGLRNRLGRGLDRILGALHAAAPDAQIILVAVYNPFSTSNPGTDSLWRRYYTEVEKDAARRNGARVADISKIVRGDLFCELTFLCDSGDLHPTDAGYRSIADRIFQVAGYQHLRGRNH